MVTGKRMAALENAVAETSHRLLLFALAGARVSAAGSRQCPHIPFHLSGVAGCHGAWMVRAGQMVVQRDFAVLDVGHAGLGTAFKPDPTDRARKMVARLRTLP